MKIFVRIFFLIILFSNISFANEITMEEKLEKAKALQEPIKPYQPEEGYVPSEKVAIEIAQAVLKPLLKHDYKKELPLKAFRKDEKWIIEGKKRKGCEASNKKCYQFDNSPVYLEIEAGSGKIITFSRIR